MMAHIPVTPIDTTGSGDAFVAGLAVGLAEQRSLVEAAWLDGPSMLATVVNTGEPMFVVDVDMPAMVNASTLPELRALPDSKPRHRRVASRHEECEHADE
jgi:bifunctional ADP-heptose synthase (sugar kinase/adenylyltransferase)